MEPRELLTPLLVGVASTLAGLAGFGAACKRKESSPGQGAAHGPWRGRRNNPSTRPPESCWRARKPYPPRKRSPRPFPRRAWSCAREKPSWPWCPTATLPRSLRRQDAWLLVYGARRGATAEGPAGWGTRAGLRAALSAGRGLPGRRSLNRRRPPGGGGCGPFPAATGLETAALEKGGAAPTAGDFPEKADAASLPNRSGLWKRRLLRMAAQAPKTGAFPEKALRPPFPAATALENGGV